MQTPRNQGARIYVAGHTGLVGSALVRQLQAQGYRNLVTRTRSELDLLDQAAVARFFAEERPYYVFVGAGKVGGVYANDTYRAEFLYENLLIQSNLIHQSFVHEVRKLVFFACSSIYPRDFRGAIPEEAVLTGPLEPTNEPFAIAKLAGLKMVESYNRQYGTDFLTLIPTNLYGVNQNCDPLNSIVIPSLFRRFHEAKLERQPSVAIWGSGRASRDFLFADDLADAAIFMLNHYSGPPVNVGTGTETTIREVAERIREIVGYEGDIVYDTSRPEGVLTKLQDLGRLQALGWRHKVELADGLRVAYDDFVRRFQDA